MNFDIFIGKIVEGSQTFWYIPENHVFHFLIREFGNLIERLGSPMKLIGYVNLIILFHLAPSRILCNKYFPRNDFLKIFLRKNMNWIFFYFLWFYVGSIKECIFTCLSMQIKKTLYEHSCSSVTVSLTIFAHLTHLAQSFFLILNAINV